MGADVDVGVGWVEVKSLVAHYYQVKGGSGGEGVLVVERIGLLQQAMLN